MSITIHHNDILTWCKEYTGKPYHAILCDPPYALSDPRDPRRGYAYREDDGVTWDAVKRKGFMNHSWDDEVAFDKKTWAALAEHLYPGAFIMAFAGTRGYHRMACAMEDAGLIIHPALGWLFSTGFPKATQISSQLDKAAGIKPRVIGKHPNPQSTRPKLAMGDGWQEEPNLTEPATPLARAWAGHRYGLQALKPSFEFIAVAQKPYQGRPVDCITSTGAGAINIDAGRINPGETVPGGGSSWGASAGTHEGWKRPAHQNYEPSDSHTMGRWPSNLCLSHNFDCTADVCAESCAVRMIEEQSGELSNGFRPNRKPDKKMGAFGPSEYGDPDGRLTPTYDDEGGAARFYFNADYMYERLEQSDPVKYEAKASTSEREAGLDDFASTTVNDGRHKSIDNAYQRGETERRNTHPTVKPISLNKWLASLLLPPEMYAPRRLLIPFSGASSEMIGALLAGWEHITGIEREQEYINISRSRLAWWERQKNRLQTNDPETILEQARVLSNEQLGLFE